MNPFVFIVGCPRSGTTLLQRVVDAHPKIAVMPEAHWIYQLAEKRTGMTPERVVQGGIVPALLEHPKFARLGITRDQLSALIGENQRATYSTFVKRIFDVYGKMQDKDLVGNKTPALVRRVGLVNELWPEAHIVHLIRDGRDVFLSMKTRALRNRGRGWAEDPVSTVALWWELNVQMGREAGRRLGSRLYYEVLYEALVKHPAEACANLCAFLGVPYTDAMLRFYENGKTRKTSLPITPGLRDWRSQMSPQDVEVFESAAGGMLDDLGYSRACPHPARELVDRSRLKRDLLLAKSRRYASAYEGAAVEA